VARQPGAKWAKKARGKKEAKEKPIEGKKKVPPFGTGTNSPNFQQEKPKEKWVRDASSLPENNPICGDENYLKYN